MADDKEIGTNCAMCKKALKKTTRYYRNGAYFCNKNCFQKKVEKDAQGDQE